jgi:ATP-dependent helicase HrpB
MENAVALATDIASLLEERDPLQKEAGSDLTLRLEMLRRWRSGERVNADTVALERIEKLATSWRKLMNIGPNNGAVADTLVGRLLMEAYPERIARQTDKNSGRYRLTNGRVARLPDHDPLMREKWLSIAHLDGGGSEGKIFLAAPILEEDLLEISEEREVVRWDETRQMITAQTEKHIAGLVIAHKALSKIPDDLRIAELLKVVAEKGLALLGWDESHSEWQARVMSLRKWRPEEAWPDVSNENLLHTLEEWLTPFLQGISKASDFQKLDLHGILASLLPWELSRKLSELAPAKLEVPSGSMIKVNYFNDGRSPVMEVRLQELFGLPETPAVNEGRMRIILHLLSPGYKPVQVTQDLKSFWNNTYAEVRKELRTRYPKHSWPDDPWTAQAIRGAKRRTQ